MMSHSNLVQDLTEQIAYLIDRDPKRAQYIAKLVTGVEAGNSEAIDYAMQIVTSGHTTLKKVFADVPQSIRASVSGAFHNKTQKQDWLKIQLDGGFNKFKGKGVFAHSFKATDWEIPDLIRCICKGASWAVGTYENDHRLDSNFISSQLLALDFDDNVAISELLEADFIQHYVTCLHPSPSHTDGFAKTRAIFVLSEPVFDSKQREIYQLALIDYFQNFNPDSKCSDSARFFYGSGVMGAMVNFDTCLPISVCEQMAEAYLQREEDKRQFRLQQREARRKDYAGNDKAKQAYINSAIDSEIRELSMCGKGERNNQLFITACNLYGMAMSGEWGISEGWVTGELERIGGGIGLKAHEVEATLKSALKTASPRYLEIG